MSANRPHLTPGQAKYVIDRMLADRRISVADIERSLAALSEEIRTHEDHLARLRGLHGPSSLPLPRPEATPPQKRPAPRRRKTGVKPGASASRQLHGRYIGYLRQIPERQRAKYKRMAVKAGKETAIARMKKALHK